MKLFLKILFSLFFLGILYGTVTASMDRGIGTAVDELWPDPWFRATLFDTYFAFLTIYLWIAYKERSAALKTAWFFAVMLFGTFAFSVYILIQVFKLKPEDPWDRILLKN